MRVKMEVNVVYEFKCTVYDLFNCTTINKIVCG